MSQGSHSWELSTGPVWWLPSQLSSGVPGSHLWRTSWGRMALPQMSRQKVEHRKEDNKQFPQSNRYLWEVSFWVRHQCSISRKDLMGWHQVSGNCYSSSHTHINHWLSWMTHDQAWIWKSWLWMCDTVWHNLSMLTTNLHLLEIQFLLKHCGSGTDDVAPNAGLTLTEKMGWEECLTGIWLLLTRRSWRRRWEFQGSKHVLQQNGQPSIPLMT